MGKGEYTDYWHFHLFPLCFQRPSELRKHGNLRQKGLGVG